MEWALVGRIASNARKPSQRTWAGPGCSHRPSSGRGDV